ncbi:hypothetical protein [Catenulispora rubra]|uniref:hypothetical protein n=1 Tax=Catenulispora rubra TaxID=280293 RepID=UPI0018922CF0|nr:hypothetical protein [Catenulispora rubra]
MSFRTRLSAAAVGALIAVGAVALPANAATASSADSPAALTKAKTTVTDGITDRLTTLGKLQTALAGYKDVPDTTRSTLTQLVSSDVSGLTALKTKVAGETTVAGVRADGKAMIDDYRVYVLVAPKVHLTHVLDVETTALARLVKVHDALADRLAKDPAADTTANKDLLADMTTVIQAADARIDGKDAALLALTPGPDGKALTASVKDVSGAAKDARDDIKKAVTDAKTVRAALKNAPKAANG